MVGMPGMHHIGRPAKEEHEKAQFRAKSFYFPLRMDNIWKEFDKISKKKLRIGRIDSFKSRCKSVALRRLIFTYVFENTDNQVIKDQIENFIAEEDSKHSILVSNASKRRKNQIHQKSSIVTTSSDEIESEEAPISSSDSLIEEEPKEKESIKPRLRDDDTEVPGEAYLCPTCNKEYPSPKKAYDCYYKHIEEKEEALNSSKDSIVTNNSADEDETEEEIETSSVSVIEEDEEASEDNESSYRDPDIVYED